MCCLWTCVSSMAASASAALELVSSTAVCAFPGRVCVSALQCSSLYCPRRCVASGLQLHACASNARICSTAANAVSRGVWPTAACTAPGRVFLVFSRTFVLHRRVCLQELCALHRGVCLQELCPAPGCVCLSFVLYLNVPVCKNFCCTCACLCTRAL